MGLVPPWLQQLIGQGVPPWGQPPPPFPTGVPTQKVFDPRGAQPAPGIGGIGKAFGGMPGAAPGIPGVGQAFGGPLTPPPPDPRRLGMPNAYAPQGPTPEAYKAPPIANAYTPQPPQVFNPVGVNPPRWNRPPDIKEKAPPTAAPQPAPTAWNGPKKYSFGLFPGGR